MPKVYASTRLDTDLYDRIARVGKADSRTVSVIIRMCIEAYLPVLESEVKEKHGKRLEAPGISSHPNNPSTEHMVKEGKTKHKARKHSGQTVEN